MQGDTSGCTSYWITSCVTLPNNQFSVPSPVFVFMLATSFVNLSSCIFSLPASFLKALKDALTSLEDIPVDFSIVEKSCKKDGVRKKSNQARITSLYALTRFDPPQPIARRVFACAEDFYPTIRFADVDVIDDSLRLFMAAPLASQMLIALRTTRSSLFITSSKYTSLHSSRSHLKSTDTLSLSSEAALVRVASDAAPALAFFGNSPSPYAMHVHLSLRLRRLQLLRSVYSVARAPPI